MSKIAIIQEAPVYLNKEKTIQKVCDLIKQAAGEGAELVIFPETFISGYPAWIWRLRPGGDWDICETSHEMLMKSAVDIKAGDLNPICDVAKELKVTVVSGINERPLLPSNGTVYNAMVTISHEGKIINLHRKLMPTNPERMTWGFGDATGLKVSDTPVGKIGGVMCWENYMPLSRYALYTQGIEIYIAPTYDSGDDWLGTMQHIAREGRCWVINSGCAIERSDIPDDFPDKDRLYAEDETWINQGDSAVIAPGGEIVAGPLRNEKGIVYYDIDATKSHIAKRALDVAGHYSRPDLFTFEVDTKPQKPTISED